MIRANRLNRPKTFVPCDVPATRADTMPRSPVRPVVLLLFCIQAALLSIAGRQSAPAQTKPPESFPGKSWQDVPSLEKAGWSKERLAAAHAYADADAIHTSAVM